MNVTYIFDEYFIYNDEIFVSLLGVRHQFTYLLTYLPLFWDVMKYLPLFWDGREVILCGSRDVKFPEPANLSENFHSKNRRQEVLL